MELQLNELLAGKPTKIKNKEYFSTEAYVTPFLDRMSKLTSEFVINVKMPDQISMTRNGEVNFDDIVYNRVWIQAVLPDEYAWDNHKRVISMLYALDTRKPLVKMYTGALNCACLNLCVFDPDCLRVAELADSTAIDYTPINTLMTATDTIKANLTKLASLNYTREEFKQNLGFWVARCFSEFENLGGGKVQLANDVPNKVYGNIFENKKSEYYTTDDVVNGFTVYNAFTKLITENNRDIVNKFEKTLLIKKILNI